MINAIIDKIINALVAFGQMLIDGFVFIAQWIIGSIPSPQSCIDVLPAVPIPIVQAVAWALPLGWIIQLLSCYMMSIMTYFSVKAFLRWL